ncbi:MAG1210 family protein [Aeromonas caviae]|uniref:MAG1210 family protein n=1 Tax=Aeromonas caviae TaxID=648 RepID=UPI002B2404F0|nr:hypothetical protein [Aeromonas caviae]MEA9428860.1 hypothetical protein [Aeromonas caviae]MEA9433461.1 hypothetical protein [Aeromonas caviae]
MIDGVYEPLALYRDQFKAKHAEITAAFFEGLTKCSGVDENANAATVAAIRAIEAQIAAADSSRSNWRIIRILAVILVVTAVIGLVLFIVPVLSPDTEIPLRVDGLWATACAGLAAGGITLIAAKLNPTIRALYGSLRLLRQHREENITEALTQLAPLNRLYDWGMITSLIHKTVPRITFDSYFSRARLNKVQRSVGWDDNFNNDKSVLFSQSGEIQGNPFVLAETLDFRMGTRTYHGSLTISWKERQKYTDSKGRSRTRWGTRIQTLHASVNKPAPKYDRNKFIIYCNEAAPRLTFSRSPSNLSNGDGLLNKWRMKRNVAKLEALSRNFDDDSDYTIMANRQFDALFHATDRNDEIQFRLLFTPLAQQQMVDLLRDDTVGFGDDFTFIKDRMVNVIMPTHLADIDITAAPSLFQNYDLAAAREFFNAYSNAYFRALYFGLAPLLTIPLYQQHRPHSEIYAGETDTTASFWEHEAIANFHGQDAFRHPKSITENILKAHHTRAMDGYSEVEITAYGFRGKERVDYVAKQGGDGRMHKIPVKWIEYVPVKRTSTLIVRETDGLTLQDYKKNEQSSPEWQSFFRQFRTEPKKVSFRRSIVSFLSPS